MKEYPIFTLFYDFLYQERNHSITHLVPNYKSKSTNIGPNTFSENRDLTSVLLTPLLVRFVFSLKRVYFWNDKISIYRIDFNMVYNAFTSNLITFTNQSYKVKKW